MINMVYMFDLTPEDPIFKVKTIDGRTNLPVYHFQSQDERSARAFFKAMLPSVQSLKSWHEVQHAPKRYTEILLVRTFPSQLKEYPVWRGFVETKYLKF